MKRKAWWYVSQELRATSVFEKRGSRRGAKPGHRHVLQKHKSRKLPRLTWQTWILRHSPKWQTWSMTTSNRPGISRPTENICTRFSVCKRGDSATVGVHVFHCKLLVFQCETWRLRSSLHPCFALQTVSFSVWNMETPQQSASAFFTSQPFVFHCKTRW